MPYQSKLVIFPKNSYTLEISLCGSTMISRQHTHFNTDDYEGLGRHFCETLLDYSDNDPVKVLFFFLFKQVFNIRHDII